ncbi:methyl-accepting chemotaxis sensory transducer with Cache sensor [Dethiosulfovibrio peptidovorans DSM 11002]|uniref:Methyl-accepting chemotaxis sensory transducer with Cache sensor n=1 Tax=Dethiosulfovibrio peptidovorans DSM 11002 TaxID=469381 RepID=D2Z6D9_9BACT|nr:methyl-accepting chemotaxis protein [Dethiosulfovibrio peptidovorans]EFC91036.1 methyl-accepting chemotaxis sensory transducer with Cache sensor [Dethiosulfovibrio peptidovorans DSM 11002]
MTIGRRFAVLLTILVLTLSGIGIATFLKGNDILENQVMETGTETVKGAAETVSQHFDMLAGIIDNTVLAVDQAWRENKREFVQMQDLMVESLQVNKKWGFQDIYFGFASNGDFATSHRLVPPEGFDARKRSWYVAAAELGKGKVALTEPYIDVTTKKPVISLSKLVYDSDGKLVGCVGADVGIGHLVEFTKKLTILGQGKGILLSTEGMVIAGPIEEDVMTRKLSEKTEADMAELGKRMTDGKSGFMEVNLNGSHTAFYTPTKWGVSLAILYPVSAIAALVHSLTLPLSVISVIALILTLAVVIFTYRGIASPLKKVSDMAGLMKERDLTVDLRSIGYDARDELGNMIAALADMVENIRETIGNITSEADSINQSSSGLAAISEQANASMDEAKRAVEEIAVLAETNAASLEETNAGVEEVSSSAHLAAESATEGTEATESATETSEKAAGLVEVVIEGVESVGRKSDDTIARMNALGESVHQITSFIETINSIADQTNLLALNAAIEAARAGEAGRGFAVVAEEVRKLAEESAKAAGKIDILIGDLQKQTGESISVTKETAEVMKDTVAKASEARKGLDETLESIKRVNVAMQNIAATSEEQAASSNEMAGAVDQASKSTVEMAQKVESIKSSTVETAKASDGVAHEAERLARLARSIDEELKRFKTGSSEIATLKK